MEQPPEHPTQAASEELTDPDWLQGVDSESGTSITAEISNAMVGLKKKFYGRGPGKAKTFLCDNYVFCVLDGGLTANELTLLDAGEDRLVRDYRLRFQEVMTGPTTEAVERITGRKVLTYHSQIMFNPAVGVEMFVLDGEPQRR
ncbi:MAG TPA: Na-translocating system protein MpsC family protein [Thermoleophilaceae bacterium]|nr:Na-translocating system protein MpsC family protein [Thermoleophilaceae bacterium]